MANVQRLTALLIVLLALLTTAYADDSDTLDPPQAEPRWRVIAVKDGEVTLNTFRFERVQKEVPYTVAVPVIETRVVNGREVKVTVTKTETRTRVVNVQQPVPTTAILEKFALYRLDGKRLSDDDIKRFDGQRLPVIAMHPKEQIDPFFKSILKPDALVLIASKDLLGPVTPPQP